MNNQYSGWITPQELRTIKNDIIKNNPQREGEKIFAYIDRVAPIIEAANQQLLRQREKEGHFNWVST